MIPCFLHSSTTDFPAAFKMAPETPVKIEQCIGNKLGNTINVSVLGEFEVPSGYSTCFSMKGKTIMMRVS